MIDLSTIVMRGAFRAPLALAGAVALLGSSPREATAQGRPFLFTVTTAGQRANRTALLSGDVAYGERLFRGVGPEHMEQSVTAQIALPGRMTLLAHVGLAPSDPAATAVAAVQGEILADLLAPGRATSLFLSVGALRDYAGTPVLLGRFGAALRAIGWEMAANVRLEHPFDDGGEVGEARRDVLDVITTTGIARRVSGSLRLGLETVAEDLEGLFDPNEAEGGAKLMVGPTLACRPPESRWQLLVGAGPVLRLSSSAVAATGGAPRDLTNRSGYVLRTALGYRW